MAEKAGGDGVLILPPYFVKLTDDEIFAHYRDVAGQTRIPILLYNIPGNAVNALTPALVRRLADLDTVVAVKESSGDWNNFYATLITVADKLRVFCGPSSIFGAPAVELGADGFIDCFPNVWSAGGRPLYDAAKSGDRKRAAELQKIGRQLTDLFTSDGPHALSGDQGRDGHAGLSRRRAPATAAAPDRRQAARRAAQRACRARPARAEPGSHTHRTSQGETS